MRTAQALRLSSLVGAAALLVASPVALAGPDWLEGNIDAGSFVRNAQITRGVGQIDSIEGTLSGALLDPDFEDMYIISITDPANFSLSVGSSSFRVQLSIFNITLANEAFGLLASVGDSKGGSATIFTTASDLTGAQISSPGFYAVAVSGRFRNAASRTGEIFNIAVDGEVSGPDGPGGLNPHESWVGQGSSGTYVITLTGSGFAEVPAPGAAALAMVGALAASRRRRSR